MHNKWKNIARYDESMNRAFAWEYQGYDPLGHKFVEKTMRGLNSISTTKFGLLAPFQI